MIDTIPILKIRWMKTDKSTINLSMASLTIFIIWGSFSNSCSLIDPLSQSESERKILSLKTYLSYLRFTDQNSNYRRKQIAPVYLAASAKYRVDNDGVFEYYEETKEENLKGVEITEDDLKRLKVDKFRNKFDPVVGSWERTSGESEDNAAFSYLITYKVNKLAQS